MNRLLCIYSGCWRLFNFNWHWCRQTNFSVPLQVESHHWVCNLERSKMFKLQPRTRRRPQSRWHSRHPGAFQKKTQRARLLSTLPSSWTEAPERQLLPENVSAMSPGQKSAAGWGSSTQCCRWCTEHDEALSFGRARIRDECPHVGRRLILNPPTIKPQLTSCRLMPASDSTFFFWS